MRIGPEVPELSAMTSSAGASWLIASSDKSVSSPIQDQQKNDEPEEQQTSRIPDRVDQDRIAQGDIFQHALLLSLRYFRLGNV